MSDSLPTPFVTFYRDEHIRLIRLLRKLGAGWDDAWDISQHTFTEALRYWDGIDAPSAWIRTTAVRAYRKAQIRATEDVVRAFRGGWQPRPHFDKLDLREEEQRVYEAIASLPSRQAEVMALTYDGFDPKEIARILSAAYPGEDVINPEAVRASLYQARQKLRRILGRRAAKRGS
jgi:RNA polymerase sigma factor (sigma-70 family)